ncbi:MAG: hypothetical protein M0Q38_04715 [Bacteroidales bacterium]|jgi:hypothetical protein|nr:hypothetical protein [Bacteroidales bacterium]
MRKIKTFLFLLVFLVLVGSASQSYLHPFKEPPLKGYFQLKENPSLKFFTWRRWFSGEFQQTYSDRMNDHVGFYNSLIRFNNQCDYSLFGLIHAKGFIQGLNCYLYEEDYLHEYNGDYFIGKPVIDKKLARLKNVQDSLRAYHIPLLLVYEPGKASFYPEYIPRRFHPEWRPQTNYSYFLQRSADLGVSYMDMNRYFLMMKDTSRYPLFPRYGMHWSLFGVTFAMDTLVRRIESETGKQLPKFNTHHLTISPTPWGTDNDIGELLNLACPLPGTMEAYPEVAFEDAPEKKNLSVLIIADSYYLNIVEDYGRKLFKNQEYWYYNDKLYPFQNNNPPTNVDKTNLLEKLKKFDIILLMVSEINLHCGFWNFADEAWTAFHPGYREPHLYRIENQIRNDREWFGFMVNKAHKKGNTVEAMVREDASYVFYRDYNTLEEKSYNDSIEYITMTIKNSAEWLALVQKKAQDQNVPLDTMLLRDAIYTYAQWKKKP